MSPTRIRLLVVLGLLGAAVGWGAFRVVEAVDGTYLPVPWLAPATLWVLAGALLVWGLLSRPRLLRRPGHRPMPPLVAARTAALAMAASRTGALVAGVYLGIGVAVLPLAGASPAGAEVAWASGAAVLGALALVLAALWLERMCRLPDQEDGLGPAPEDEAGEGRGSWVAPAARDTRPAGVGPPGPVSRRSTT